MLPSSQSANSVSLDGILRTLPLRVVSAMQILDPLKEYSVGSGADLVLFRARLEEAILITASRRSEEAKFLNSSESK
jgi:hypothetical protein